MVKEEGKIKHHDIVDDDLRVLPAFASLILIVESCLTVPNTCFCNRKGIIDFSSHPSYSSHFFHCLMLLFFITLCAQ